MVAFLHKILFYYSEWQFSSHGAICNNGPVVADNLNFSMALPPSVIFWDFNFAGKT